MRRRMWPFNNLESGRALRISTLIYLAVSPVLLCLALIAYFSFDRPTPDIMGSFWAAVHEHAPLFLGLSYLLGMGLIGLLTWKCRYCRSGPGRRITTALEKMGRGDLGWKITLRRGDELADMADSVTRASESLADRINKLQLQARQLTEIENYLIDSVDTDRISNPYTLKALRKLKICTSRLNANIDDFHVSTVSSITPVSVLQSEKPAEELEKV